ncbi:hypothetical protein [Nocardioides convexus]|uniref:hypothetical protein n=1 Tax=Nocardioides convexus TaxID=2712224 RepID=UPI0024184FD8|nr:hypothetical protein [Nocardioides convexus]
MTAEQRFTVTYDAAVATVALAGPGGKAVMDEDFFAEPGRHLHRLRGGPGGARGGRDGHRPALLLRPRPGRGRGHLRPAARRDRRRRPAAPARPDPALAARAGRRGEPAQADGRGAHRLVHRRGRGPGGGVRRTDRLGRRPVQHPRGQGRHRRGPRQPAAPGRHHRRRPPARAWR